jgi:ABC-type spermidine/putrescine transport system permease subunit I
MANVNSVIRSAATSVDSMPIKAVRHPANYYWILLMPSVGALLAFFFAPLAIMFDQSFHKFDSPMQSGPIEYTFLNYLKFFSDVF